MTSTRLVVLAGMLVACQPWYRDAAQRGRVVLDHDRTARELAAARAARAAGDHARCAELLRTTIDRTPAAGGEVWVELVECELAADHTVEARAHARWKLARLHVDDPIAARLRAPLIESLARDGLIAQALDQLVPSTLATARAYPTLAAALRDVDSATALARWPNQMRLGLEPWLDRYGEPDHVLLRDTRERIATALWTAANRADAPANLVELRAWPDLIRAELSSGDLAGALLLYARARLLLPTPLIEPLQAEVERAAAAAGITALLPDIHALAREGDAALRDGKLGTAIARYRLVVARAPWWTAARANLDAMLALDR